MPNETDYDYVKDELEPSAPIYLYPCNFLSRKARFTIRKYELHTVDDLIAFYETHNRHLETIRSIGIDTANELVYLIDYLTKSPGKPCCSTQEIIASFEQKRLANFSEFQTADPANEYPFFDLPEDIGSQSVCILALYGIHPVVLDRVLSKGYRTLSDLKEYSTKAFCNIFAGISCLAPELSAAIKALKQSNLHERVRELFLETLSDREYFILSEWAAGRSYRTIAKNIKPIDTEMTGKSYVSQQRIIQMVKDITVKLTPMLLQVSYVVSCGKPYFRVEDSSPYCSDPNELAILNRVMISAFSPLYEYLGFCHVFMLRQCISPDSDYQSDFEKLVERVIGEGVNLATIEAETCQFFRANGFPYICTEDILNFCKINGYRVFGTYVSPKCNGHLKFCEYLVETDFPNGIQIAFPIGPKTCPDLSKLREIAKTQYGYTGLPGNDIVLVKTLRKILLQKDSHTFIAKGNITIDHAVMEQIHEFLSNQNIRRYYYIDLFKVFKVSLETRCNIYNPYLLRSALKEYYPTQYLYERTYLEKQ